MALTLLAAGGTWSICKPTMQSFHWAPKSTHVVVAYSLIKVFVFKFRQLVNNQVDAKSANTPLRPPTTMSQGVLSLGLHWFLHFLNQVSFIPTRPHPSMSRAYMGKRGFCCFLVCVSLFLAKVWIWGPLVHKGLFQYQTLLVPLQQGLVMCLRLH